MKILRSFVILAISFFAFKATNATELTIMGGMGPWFSDDTKASYSYGGGLLFGTGLDWLNFAATFDRSPIKLKTADRYGPALKNDSLNHYRLLATFPSPLQVFGRTGSFYGSVAYALVTNSPKYSHGGGVGGGLALPLYEKLGIRFDALSQFYKIPIQSGGMTALQQDFFLSIRLTYQLI